MNERQKLFGTAGIRGPYSTKVTAELVINIGQIIADLCKGEGIIVGHDARTSSEALSQSACSAISLAGGKVYSVGLCTFPVIANLTRDEKHSVAIYITASHNPPQDNGIKVLRNGREFIQEEQNKIEQKIEARADQVSLFQYVSWDKIQAQHKISDANETYMKRLVEELDFLGDGRGIILDCANGPMSNLAPQLFSKLGFQVTTINSHVDGHFPGRLAEPSPANLGTLLELCKEKKTMGAAFDGDGDRIAIIDETGEFVELSRLNALFATFAIEEEGPGNVIVSIDTSTTIDKTIEKLGATTIRTNLGELHGKIKELMERKEKVTFAAEPWKPIFPSWGFWIDGLFALAKLLKVITKRKTTVYDIMKDIPVHIAERKAYLVKVENILTIFDNCKEKLIERMKDQDGIELTIDGLRYDLSDGTWILIRKSGTEPKIRIYYESPTMERFKWVEHIVRELEDIVIVK
ncbi:MAG: phosphoglucosamine mutase [Candidatus Heimdallarchaeota archaeon]|nr:phosphoglucosamine mutase [Candidatus Heimdallarchaeota archaeon]